MNTPQREGLEEKRIKDWIETCLDAWVRAPQFQVREEWEEEFKKQFCAEDMDYEAIDRFAATDVDSFITFIRNLLTAERTALKVEVARLIKSEEIYDSYNTAILDVLQLLDITSTNQNKV